MHSCSFSYPTFLTLNTLTPHSTTTAYGVGPLLLPLGHGIGELRKREEPLSSSPLTNLHPIHPLQYALLLPTITFTPYHPLLRSLLSNRISLISTSPHYPFKP